MKISAVPSVPADVEDVGNDAAVAELEAVVRRLEGQRGQVLDAVQMRDDLEGVALVDEEGLPLGRVVHLVGVLADEAVEEGVEALVVAIRLDRAVRQDA